MKTKKELPEGSSNFTGADNMTELHFSKAKIIRPCNICHKIISLNDVVYCPECGDGYHRECWQKVEKKCIVKGCSGNTRLPSQLDNLLFGSWLLKKNLSAQCENCKSYTSVLARYCHNCGSEVNSVKVRGGIPLFSTAKWTQRNFYSILAFFVILLLVGIGLTSITVGSFVQTIAEQGALVASPEAVTNKLFATMTPSRSLPTKTPRTPLPSSTTDPSITYARISCDEGIFQAAIRKSPGYVYKNDSEDVVVRVPCGEYVRILGEHRTADDLTWWKVTWNGNKGWMADHTGSGKTILIFN